VAARSQLQLEGTSPDNASCRSAVTRSRSSGWKTLAKVGGGDVFEAETGVFERPSIGIERAPIGREHVDGLRYHVRDPAQLSSDFLNASWDR